MLRTVALVTALTVAGCGLTQTRGPDPQRPRDVRPDCTESFAAPKRDAIGALAGFITIIVGALFYDVGDNHDVGVPMLAGGGVLMAGSYISGGIGYYRIKACRKAIKELEERQPIGAPRPPR